MEFAIFKDYFTNHDKHCDGCDKEECVYIAPRTDLEKFREEVKNSCAMFVHMEIITKMTGRDLSITEMFTAYHTKTGETLTDFHKQLALNMQQEAEKRAFEFFTSRWEKNVDQCIPIHVMFQHVEKLMQDLNYQP